MFSSAFAQRGRSGTKASKSKSYPIVGKVVHAEGNKALEYATVSLFRQADSSVVTGIVTNAKGIFELEAPAGTYFLTVSFLGFESVQLSDILLDELHPFVRVKEILLKPKETTLDEVNIQAEKSRLEFALDKKVFNVGQDLANNGGTAADLLDNIPSVTVDIEGNVSVRGDDGVRLLINGKPSGFTSINQADALKQLSANQIEKVEIITNPSSRYEAEGTAGILNIVLKKERRKGWNGSFEATGGIPTSHNLTLNVNHRRNKLNFFVGGGLRYRNVPRISNEHREDWASGELEILDQESKYFRGGLSGSLRMGIDYQVGERSTLTGSIMYRKGLDFSNGTLNYFSRNAQDQLVAYDKRTTEEDEDEFSLDYNLSFERNFVRKGHKFTVDFIYSSGAEVESMDAIEQAFDGNLAPKGGPDLLQRINNGELEREITLKADYTQPFRKDGRFESGYRSSLRFIGNDYLVEEQNTETRLWESIQEVSNDFEYDEQIHALYANVGDKINKFSYQLGLRAEYTRITTLLKTTNELNDREYANLFPSAFLNYEIKTGNALQMSYSRRLRRPRFHSLNPFFTYSNPRSIRSGNPNLDPEFSHSVEMSYLKYWDKATFSTSIYYRHTTGDVTYIVEDDTIGGVKVFRTRPENVATRDDIGAEFSLQVNPVKWWDMTWSGNVFRGQINGENLGFARRTSFFSLSSRLNSRFSLARDVNIQLMLNFRGPENTPQGKRRSTLYTDVGINKDILKKKATISVRMSDLFNTSWYRSETFGGTGTPEIIDDFYIFREGQWRARRQLYITFSYRLNQKKRMRRGGRQSGGGDYEMDGM